MPARRPAAHGHSPVRQASTGSEALVRKGPVVRAPVPGSRPGTWPGRAQAHAKPRPWHGGRKQGLPQPEADQRARRYAARRTGHSSPSGRPVRRTDRSGFLRPRHCHGRSRPRSGDRKPRCSQPNRRRSARKPAPPAPSRLSAETSSAACASQHPSKWRITPSRVRSRDGVPGILSHRAMKHRMRGPVLLQRKLCRKFLGAHPIPLPRHEFSGAAVQPAVAQFQSFRSLLEF
jgi:hypothetical protein